MKLGPKISIIIPTYNRLNLLTECIKSIYKQKYKNFEILVIDDNSEEDVFSGIKKKFPDVKIFRNKKNMGASYNKNLGTIKSDGEYILYLDSDVEFIDDQTLSNFLKLYNKKMGQLGGELILENGKPVGVTGNTFSLIGTPPYIEIGNEKVISECDFLNTCNCFMEKEKILNVGGFDPYYVYFFEDMDFGFRVIKKYKNFFSLKTGVNHKYSNQFRQNRNYAFYRNEIRFGIKNHGLKKSLIWIGHNLLVWNLVMLEYLRIKPFIKRLLKKGNNVENYEIIRKLGNLSKDKLKFSSQIENLWYLFFAIFWNFLYLKRTLSSRNKNFLNVVEMERYKKPLFV